jgi:pimeloyl-ACP methyl ester carboxylesterase
LDVSNPWEDYFTVVQWDQRNAGKSYNSNDPAVIAATLSTERMENDSEEVVQYLRRAYHKDKIFVMGHSWGSTLGLIRLLRCVRRWCTTRSGNS